MIKTDMDEIYDKSPDEEKDDAAVYLDCTRLIEGGHVNRFESIATKFDVVQYEINDGPSKPLLFYAIEHNDEVFVKLLLEMEIPLEKIYSVMVPVPLSTTGELVQKTLTVYEYAREFQRDYIADLITHRMKLPAYDERFFRILQLNDVRRCDAFIRKLIHEKRQQDLARKGFFHAAQLGSVRLLDYFLSRWKIDIDIQEEQDNGYATTALLTAITCQQNEAAKFLLFRGANPSIKGRYDNALVTALHYQSKNDLLRLLLDKHVDLTARHPDYSKLTLREYCILTNRVQAKKELDGYIIRLISQGNYQRLKWLVDRGYRYINVNVGNKRNGRQLAKERYFDKIVKLIDQVEHAEMQAKIKMNY